MILIRKKKKVGNAMWVMECPKCGKICASASERSWLPDFTSCDCDNKRLTPIMKQFFNLKAKHPDALLLFRCGDFYETYNDDAVDCGRILGVTVRKYHETETHDVKVAGFPYHALDTYLPKLIRAGRRVAICDQLENPNLTKKLVKRGITDMVKPSVDNES